MSWGDLHQELLSWTNLNDRRPFVKLGTKPIIDGTLTGLSKRNPDLEKATLALDELSQRSRLAAGKGIIAISDALEEIGHATIPWLLRVRQNLNHLRYEHRPKQSYQTTLYVILRDGYSEQNGRYGIYVGETSKSAEERFEEHLSGTRSARGLQEHGIQLLYSLMWPWQKVPRSEGYNLYYESALHAALKVDSEKGPRLSGNIEDIENWPMNFQMKLQHFLSG